MDVLKNVNNFRSIVLSAVEECTENEFVEKERFIDLAQCLDFESFKNIAEERCLNKCCGYVLCRNELRVLDDRKYKIISNRVFDVSDRKLFCSDVCYKCYLYFLGQLPEEPLWIVGQRKSISFHVLNSDDDNETEFKSIIGVEIPLEPAGELAKALQNLNINDHSDQKSPKDFDLKPSKTTKLVQEIERMDENLINDDDESVENYNFTTVKSYSDSDSSCEELHIEGGRVDNLSGWRAKGKSCTKKSENTVLEEIRRKYFISNKKSGFSMKRPMAPTLIEPKPFPNEKFNIKNQ